MSLKLNSSDIKNSHGGTYISSVKRRLYRNKPAMVGLYLAAFFFFLAVFAPFLAGNRPLILKDGNGLSFPVFSSFSAEDFLWLSIFFILLASMFFKWRYIKITGALIILAIITAFFWPVQLDRTDYSAYRDGAAAADICIMPMAPYSPSELNSAERYLNPCANHLFGTDEKGGDICSRLIHGARVSMLVGFVAVSIYVLLGVVIGAIAGYFGGIMDMLLCRFMEVIICFPVFFALLAVFCFLPPSIFWIMIIIGLFRWPGIARLTRGEFLRLKEEEFVTAGKALGCSSFRIIFLQIMPNSLAPVLVAATFGIAGAILMESGLSFLGFGVQPPTPSWGKMLADGRESIGIVWPPTFFPGFAIFSVVCAFNLLGEGLRDALDPKLKE